jgi:hypothetical protein
MVNYDPKSVIVQAKGRSKTYLLINLPGVIKASRSLASSNFSPIRA